MPAALLLAAPAGRTAEPLPPTLASPAPALSLPSAAAAMPALPAPALPAPDASAAMREIPAPDPQVRSATPATVPLYLEVSLNQTAYGPPQPFQQQADGRLYARVATLRAIGFALDGHDPDALLAPADLPGVNLRYDAAQQRAAIDAPLSLLRLSTTRLNTPGGQAPPASASPGLLLNYDLYASRDDRGDSATAFAELRAFGLGGGVLSQTAVTRHYRSDGAPRRTDSVRLDSAWRWSRPQSMLSLTVGDLVSGQLDWTRPLRLGGVRIGRDFGLQPYRITTPLPTFLGEVAVPSSVDLYVDGLRQYSGQLPPGPFQLATVPGVSGAGNAQLVVTDAFGRVRTLDFPFYASRQLLARGLTDGSLSLGLAREDYGLRSFAYGSQPLASAELRHGLSDRLTVEAHAEGGAGLANGGLGAVWLLGRAGVARAAVAHGGDGRGSGWQYAAAYNWSNGRFNIALDTRRTQGRYRDLASRYDLDPPRVSERAVIGWSDARLGSLGLGYVRQIQRGEPAARYASASWTRSFGRNASLGLTYNQNLDRRADRSVYLGLSLALERGRQMSVSAQRAGRLDQAALELSQPIPGDGGFGWRLQARGGDGDSGGLAELGWLTGQGRVQFGLARQGDHDYGYASADGALAWMGGHVFAARRIDDAFAVVSTDGVAGVPVLLENRRIGRTDEDGLLLVVPLNAWQRNRVGIDPMELPADRRIAQVEADATPKDRSGVLLRFPIQRVRAALLSLRDAAGQPLALGSPARSEAGESAVVGYDGELYLEGLQERNEVRVDTPVGPCRVRFDAPPADGGIARIGPLACAPEAGP